MARVRITKLPKALSGLEMKMSAGLYGKGTNGNPQFRKSSYLEAGKISQQPTEVRDTLQPVAREGANLEAEKGETAMVNIDGIPAHFKIGGKRHSEGGTPLNLPDNSFIFSDTAKMKIKDPIMLAQFGMVPKKSGYTPAEIAKKYDINKLRQVLADPNTTDLERKTAEMMIANYNMKLAKLALLQESSKGFPQGIPVVAMPYVMATGMNPEEFAQMDTQGEEEQPEADMGVSRYGGIPKAQKGAVQDSVKHQARRTLLYEKGDPKNPNTGGGYNKGKAFGLADYGYHESQKVPGDPSFTKPSTLQQATDKFMEEVDPRNASYFPMALTRGQANDFLFSTGRDIRPYIVDQLYKEKYGKSEGVPNRSQYNVDTKNVRDSKGKLRYPGKKEFTKDIENRIDSLWNANLPQWNQLSYDQQQALMGLGRQSYGRSINRGPGEPNENLEQYKEVWHGRIPNLNSANYDKEIWWDQNHRYGGNIISQFDTKQYGGLPTAQEGNTVLNKYKNAYVEVPTKPWIGGDGKLHTTDIRFKPFKLSETPSYYGYQGIKDYASEMRGPIKNIFDPVEDITESEAIKKLNPYNAEGVIDYGMNIMNMPLYLTNAGWGSGKMETTGNLWTDVGLDPLTYVGLSPVKYGAKAVVKYGPRAAKAVVKYGKIAKDIIEEKSLQGLKWVANNAEKGIDWIVANIHKIIPEKELAQNIIASFLSRGAAGASQEISKNKEIKKLEEEKDYYKDLASKLQTAPTAATTVTSVLQPKTKKPTTTPITETNQPKKYNWVK